MLSVLLAAFAPWISIPNMVIHLGSLSFPLPSDTHSTLNTSSLHCSLAVAISICWRAGERGSATRSLSCLQVFQLMASTLSLTELFWPHICQLLFSRVWLRRGPADGLWATKRRNKPFGDFSGAKTFSSTLTCRSEARCCGTGRRSRGGGGTTATQQLWFQTPAAPFVYDNSFWAQDSQGGWGVGKDERKQPLLGPGCSPASGVRCLEGDYGGSSLPAGQLRRPPGLHGGKRHLWVPLYLWPPGPRLLLLRSVGLAERLRAGYLRLEHAARLRLLASAGSPGLPAPQRHHPRRVWPPLQDHVPALAGAPGSLQRNREVLWRASPVASQRPELRRGGKDAHWPPLVAAVWQVKALLFLNNIWQQSAVAYCCIFTPCRNWGEDCFLPLKGLWDRHLFVTGGSNLLLGVVFAFFCFSELDYFGERFVESGYGQWSSQPSSALPVILLGNPYLFLCHFKMILFLMGADWLWESVSQGRKAAHPDLWSLGVPDTPLWCEWMCTDYAESSVHQLPQASGGIQGEVPPLFPMPWPSGLWNFSLWGSFCQKRERSPVVDPASSGLFLSLCCHAFMMFLPLGHQGRPWGPLDSHSWFLASHAHLLFIYWRFDYWANCADEVLVFVHLRSCGMSLWTYLLTICKIQMQNSNDIGFPAAARHLALMSSESGKGRRSVNGSRAEL